MSSLSLSAIWQSVIFDPLSYIHKQRFQISPDLIATPAARTAVNDLILAAWQLDTGGYENIQEPLTQLMLRQWLRLPQAAYLLGCYTLRADLARQGALLGLPEWARTFLTLNQGVSRPVYQKVPDNQLLLNVGYTQLTSWHSCLPKPLAQRFPLLFPSFIEDLSNQHSVELSILLLALQHAKNYPNTFPS